MKMVTQNHKNYWQYFLTIEDDLIKLSRFIEFDSENYSTYSIELVRILLVSCSEIDVLLKLLCKELKPDCDCKNIGEYADVILEKIPLIQELEIYIPEYSIKLLPWEGWKKGNKPEWWNDYTNIKHQRQANYKKASLKNALYAVAALYAVEILYYTQLEQHSVEGHAINLARYHHDLIAKLFELDSKYDPTEFG